MQVSKNTFSNGSTCLLYPTKDETLNVSVHFPGGRLFETEKNAGITYLMLRTMMNEGLSQIAADTIDGDVGIENHADFFGFSLNTTASHFGDALKVLHQIITCPILSKAALIEEKATCLEQIQGVYKDPLRRPVELFYKSLFAGHPYGLSRYGNENSMDEIEIEDLQQWHKEIVHIDKLLVTVVGNLSKEKVESEIFEVFGMIPVKTQTRRASVIPLIPSKRFTPRIEETTQKQTNIVIGHKGVDVRDHRYYDLEILRNWLAGARGQLHISLREKLSLAKNVNAYNVSLLRGGAFFLHATTAPARESSLVEYMEAFFSSLNKLAISKDAFESAKQQAVDMFSQGLRKEDAISYYMASQYMANKPIESIDDYKHHIQDVSLAKLQSTLTEVFPDQSYAVGITRGAHG